MARPIHIDGLELLSPNRTRNEQWGARKRRVDKEMKQVGLHLLSAVGVNPPPLPVTVTITRLGPRALDGDNLQGACKAVRDAVAKYLRVDDADPRITWAYAQAKGAYAVRIQIVAGERHA